VKRLSNRFNWIVEVDSVVGEGTKIEVIFDELSSPAGFGKMLARA